MRNARIFSALGIIGMAALAAFPVRAQEPEARVPVEASVSAFAEMKEDAQPLQEMLRRAYQNNPRLQAARAELRAVDETLPLAQSGWMPAAEAGASVIASSIDPSSGGEDGTVSREVGISLTQPLYRGGRTVAATESATSTIMAQRAIVNAAEQGILLEAATAYMDVVRDRALVDLSLNNKEVIFKQLEATKDRFEVGEVTKTDVSQAEARYARAESERIRVSGNLQSSLARYEQVIGVPAGSLTYPAFSLTLPKTLEEALSVAENHNPTVLAAQSLHRASQSDISTVFGELLPELGLVASWNKDFNPQPGGRDDASTGLFGLSATIPLYEAGSTRARVRAARHVANQRFIEIQDEKSRTRQDVITNWENLLAARGEIKSREAEVQANDYAREGVRQEAQLGSRTILDALDADQEYLDAQVALTTARRNEIVATFALANALGLLTPAMLGFGDMTYNPDLHLKEADWNMLETDVDIDPAP